MNVAIDISPIDPFTSSDHKVRGVGYYIQHLQSSLQNVSSQNTFHFISQIANISSTTDVLHIPYFDPFFLHLPKKKKVPTVITIHDLTPIVFADHFPVGVKGKLKWQIQKFLARQADAIITDSVASKKDVVHVLGYPEEKVFPIYLAADSAFGPKKVSEKEKDILSKKYHLPDKFILYVGDATWNKNLPRFLDALVPTRLPLVMVGKAVMEKKFDRSNPWTKDLQYVQHIANTQQQIILTGFVPTEDLVTIYNLATCLVMPSLYEGFGLPVVEAMQSGCPVITTKSGSLAEVAGDAALFVDPSNNDDIVSKIQHLYNDTTLQKQLSLRGLKQAEKFSWEQTSHRTVEVYKFVYEANSH